MGLSGLGPCPGRDAVGPGVVWARTECDVSAGDPRERVVPYPRPALFCFVFEFYQLDRQKNSIALIFFKKIYIRLIPWGFWRPIAMRTKGFNWLAQEAPGSSLTDCFLGDRNKNPSGCREMEPTKHILGRIRSRDVDFILSSYPWRRWVVRMSYWRIDLLAGNVTNIQAKP